VRLFIHPIFILIPFQLLFFVYKNLEIDMAAIDELWEATTHRLMNFEEPEDVSVSRRFFNSFL
jgi:hypothetical protein